MRLTIKTGRSLFGFPLETNNIQEMAEVIRELQKEGHQLIVVVGGGSLSRQYIDFARCFQLNWAAADQIGIEASRLNARLMIAALGNCAFPTPALDLEEILRLAELGKVVVAGGLTPGQSTDAVAALASELTESELFIKTMDVDGIYDKDPKKTRDSRFFDEIRYDDLKKIVFSSYNSQAGGYSPLDLVALEILRRSKISTVFVGHDPGNLKKLVSGVRVGTRLTYE